MLTGVLETPTLRAETVSPECTKLLKEADDVLDKADKAITDLVNVGEAKDRVIKDLEASNAALVLRVEDSKAWYHNPVTVGILGLAVGVLGGVYVSR